MIRLQDWEEFAKTCTYTKEDILNMSYEDLCKNIFQKCTYSQQVGFKLGWFDGIEEGTPFAEIPRNLLEIYSDVPTIDGFQFKPYFTKHI